MSSWHKMKIRIAEWLVYSAWSGLHNSLSYKFKFTEWRELETAHSCLKLFNTGYPNDRENDE